MSRSPRSPTHRWLLGGAWLAALAGLAVVVARYDRLPAWLPVFRAWSSGAAVRLMHKSAIVALRIPLMGVGQLAAATLLANQARRAGIPGWLRFWTGTAAAIAGKTLLESLDLASLSIASLVDGPPPLFIATIALVVAYAGWAAWLWKSGRLERRQELQRTTALLLVVALGLYVALATWPLWSGAPSLPPRDGVTTPDTAEK